MTLTRRDWLRLTAGGGAALALTPDLLASLARQEVLARAIPGTDETIPVVGLGSSATFSRVARSEDVTAIRNVLQTFVDNGGTVFDTAPGYGASEQVAGDVANELGIQNRIFWATKVNVAGRGGGGADPAAARALTLVGTYTASYNIVHPLMALVFGLIGFILKRHNIPVVPIVLGLVLGPIFEARLRQALGTAAGDMAIFVERPYSAGLLAIMAIAMIGIALANRQRRRRERTAAAGDP